jgi:hypothetical protein
MKINKARRLKIAKGTRAKPMTSTAPRVTDTDGAAGCQEESLTGTSYPPGEGGFGVVPTSGASVPPIPLSKALATERAAQAAPLSRRDCWCGHSEYVHTPNCEGVVMLRSRVDRCSCMAYRVIARAPLSKKEFDAKQRTFNFR